MFFSSLGPCTRWIAVLPTKLLQPDSWTDIFRGSIINRVLIRKATRQDESASIYLQIGKMSCSSSALPLLTFLPVFLAALLQITACPDTEKQEGFRAKSPSGLSAALCRTAALRRRMQFTRRWHQEEFFLLVTWQGAISPHQRDWNKTYFSSSVCKN